MKRLIRWGIAGGFIVSWVLLLAYFWTNDPVPFGPIIEDVSKRIESPYHLKTAHLIRRRAFDLNFVLKIVDGNRSQTIYTPPDYNTDPTIDCNERINGHATRLCSFFASDGLSKNSLPQTWAFDFSVNAPVADSGKISDK